MILKTRFELYQRSSSFDVRILLGSGNLTSGTFRVLTRSGLVIICPGTWEGRISSTSNPSNVNIKEREGETLHLEDGGF